MAAFTAMAIAALASASVSAYKAHQAGQAAKAAGLAGQAASESQAELSEYNAKIADLQSQDAIAKGALDEAQYRAQVRGVVGAQRADLAGSGVDVTSGSALSVQADAARLGELDALTIRTNAARAAWGYDVQASDLRAEAGIQRKEGANLAKAGGVAASQANLEGIGTIAGTGATLLATKYGMK